MKMKYIVKIDYHKFEFDDADCAIVFAGTAKKNHIDKDDVDVEIEILVEEEEMED